MLGGTFDPIHNGHIAAARAAMECAALDRVLLVPSAQPPHRAAAEAPAAMRLEMCRLAVRGERGLEVSDVEIARGGASYTADTLEQLSKLYPDDRLFLILGWDAARLFSTWHKPEQVRRLATVVVVSRPGTPEPDPDQLAQAGLDPNHLVLCLADTPDISASGLREALARGDSVAERLPREVELFVARHGLYGDNRRVASK